MVTTFVPYADITKSCEVLDTPRLGKQRSEIKIILAALTGVRFKRAQGEHGIVLPEKRGYMNHSATRMWRGHERALAFFGYENCRIWMERLGHDVLDARSTGYDTLRDMDNWMHWLDGNGADTAMPNWWGREDVHASHRSVLLFKDPVHYGQFDWSEEPKYEYVWPV